MHTDESLFVGAGGHARVVLDAFLVSHQYSANPVFADDNPSLLGKQMMGFPILGSVDSLVKHGSLFHVAIGRNDFRRNLMRRCLELGGFPFDVVHPSAQVSSFATVGAGSFVAAGAIVAPAASTGVSVIINHGAVVDHDCTIGDFSHIAPNATLGGSVRVGSNVLIGTGANILPGVSVADDAIVGAGSVVLNNVCRGQIVAGIPARPLVKSSS